MKGDEGGGRGGFNDKIVCMCVCVCACTCMCVCLVCVCQKILECANLRISLWFYA